MSKPNPKSESRKPVTQKTIAEKLGISQETVSHILSEGPRRQRYSEQTQKTVLKAARELGYRPHRGAQLMRNGKSNLVGVIHFGSRYELAAHTSRFLPAELKAKGYRVLVVDLSWQGDTVQGAVGQLIEARVEGVIITQMIEGFGREEVELLSKAGIPVITLAGNDKLGIPGVYSEVQSAMEKLVAHLVGLGHRQLLLINPDYHARPSLERRAGFSEGIRNAGGALVPLEESADKVGQWLKETPSGIHGGIVKLKDATGHDVSFSAYRFARELFAKGIIPDVMVCSNDLWARGVFSAALEAGLAVPETVAITGLDDEAFGVYPPFYLTTISQSRQEECAKVVEILDGMIRGVEPAQQFCVFPSKLVVRRSCGNRCPPEGA